MREKNKTLFMETTKIEPSQTVIEIQKILGKYGASAIRTDYDERREVVAISFTIKIDEGDPIAFRLPCRWKEVEKLLDEKHPPDSYIYHGKLIQRNNLDQAKRVAWRQILRWVEAQLSITETNMVKLHEVFMPYLVVEKGQTLFEKIESQNWKFQLEYKKAVHK
jgi:hypothetical protein